MTSVNRRMSLIHESSEAILSRLSSSEDQMRLKIKTNLINSRCNEYVMCVTSSYADIIIYRLSNATKSKMEAVKREMKSRDNLNAELRDMLSWIDDVSDDAERTLDLSATPACVQDQLDTLRQVFDVITIMMTSFDSLYCS